MEELFGDDTGDGDLEGRWLMFLVLLTLMSEPVDEGRPMTKTDCSGKHWWWVWRRCRRELLLLLITVMAVVDIRSGGSGNIMAAKYDTGILVTEMAELLE